VGINGSGKSSLFMHLADVLLASRSGSTIRIDGRPASVAYVPQHPALPGWLTPREVARVYGLEFDALAAAMPGLHLREIARTGVAALSAGQRQVLALALALGRAADITLLDEPFTALDFRRRIGAIDLLTALRSN